MEDFDLPFSPKLTEALLAEVNQWPKVTGFATTHYPQCHSYSVPRGDIQLNISHPIDTSIFGQRAKHTRSSFASRKSMKTLKDERYVHSDVLSCFVPLFNRREMEKKDRNPDYKPAIMVDL